MPLTRLIFALFVVVALALSAAAGAQTPTQTRTLPSQDSGSRTPPVDLDGDEQGEATGENSSTEAKKALPDTGTDPRLLFLTGVALTLLGVGLRLRTADADEY